MREVGHNAGPQVEKYQRAGGGRKGDAWCSWFVTWCLRTGGVLTAKFGAARSWFDKRHIIWQQGRGATPRPGDVVGYQWNGGPHINHVGIIERWGTGVTCLTIEGNTGGGRALLREGQGVYRNWRDKRQVRAVADVISNPKY